MHAPPRPTVAAAALQPHVVRLGLGYDLRHGGAGGFGCLRGALQGLPSGADPGGSAGGAPLPEARQGRPASDLPLGADLQPGAEAGDAEARRVEEEEMEVEVEEMDGPCGALAGEAARATDRMSAEAMARLDGSLRRRLQQQYARLPVPPPTGAGAGGSLASRLIPLMCTTRAVGHAGSAEF